jgi:hypothetical protein
MEMTQQMLSDSAHLLQAQLGLFRNYKNYKNYMSLWQHAALRAGCV